MTMATEPEKRWPDLCGRIEGGKHVFPVRVYHEDTDFTGLVYHANFLKFCERARSDFVRLAGLSQTGLFAGEGGREPAAFVVRHMEVDFLKPARMDDVLEIITSVDEIGGAALTLLQDVTRDETVLARLRVKIVLVGESGKVMRLGELVRASLEPFVNQEG
ncbi:MAG: YbgC/FadM family acyl-CoA thioesterase [Methyloligellaceae bacterium]